MKRILLALFIFFSLQVQAQSTKPITSFLGVKFGSTPAQVIAGLKLKGGIFNKAASKPNMLVFDNLRMGGRLTDYTFVSFVNNKAARAGFVFKPELEAQTVDYYNDLVANIAKVYGDGDATKTFKEPYEDGDGYETTAISTGKADFKTFWGLGDENQPGAIMAMITEKLIVLLTYQDKALANLLDERNEKKNNADF